MQVDHLGSIVLKFGEEQTGRQADRQTLDPSSP